MATSTERSRVFNAILIQKQIENAYIALGRTQVWSDEDRPPNENPGVDHLEQLIGYKKVSKMSVARQKKGNENLDYPTVQYKDSTWYLIPSDQAYKENASWLYIEAIIEPGDFGDGTYRQVGLYFGVKPKKGKTASALKPTDLSDKGILQVYENKQRVSLEQNTKIHEQYLLKL